MSAEDFEGIRMLAKQNHAERVAKTPERIEYAEKRFKDENIAYKILNKSIGHFHVFDEFGNLFQFWASTGKITYAKNTKDARGFKSFTDERGIENCIKIVKYRNLKRQNSKTKEICDKIRKFANEYRVSVLTDEYVNYYDLLDLLNDIEKGDKNV